PMPPKEEYTRWLPKADADIVDELKKYTDKEIEDSFYRNLAFGTGGLRGTIGAGTNRINVHTIGKATQGLADYLNKTVENPSVVIGYDSRIKSGLFAKIAADVFSANGIKVYLWSELNPVPILSFTVRYLHASAGVMITASHNPSKYNGYKVYDSDGCQITTEAAAEILAEIEKLDIFADVKTGGDETKIEPISPEVLTAYIEEVKRQSEDGQAYFAQGTIYPDRIESGKGKNEKSAVIKTHHNMVEQPKDVQFLGTIEPLKDLFKDEVRAVGEALGLPHDLVWRQPFPGPGLGVRIVGEITEEKTKILQEADWILRDEMHKNGYESELAQFFCVLPGVKSVGVMGDFRTYADVIVIRAVTTDDFMTADWARIPFDILAKVSGRITNEMKGIVNRVVYDITSKPPATVEWE
ncbi:MAG: hypothetical protein HUJ75_07000, partial [Parasporobacterium sp.]|nr:hypothetical protein [Parasporobacterium sp.]